MPIWVTATVCAGLFQTWRTALQQKLRGQLSVNAAAVVRYLYGVPFGVAFVLLYLGIFGGSLSPPSWLYLFYCVLGGFGQIIGTNLLIMSFGHRGFAVGTAYSKTEAVQAAFLSLVFLGESFAPLAWLGMVRDARRPSATRRPSGAGYPCLAWSPRAGPQSPVVRFC